MKKTLISHWRVIPVVYKGVLDSDRLAPRTRLENSDDDT